MAYKTIVEDNIDILVVGAGLGGSGAAWEARFGVRTRKSSLLRRPISIAPAR
jgi:adenylylsulfate reductase subunit A